MKQRTKELFSLAFSVIANLTIALTIFIIGLIVIALCGLVVFTGVYLLFNYAGAGI